MSQKETEQQRNKTKEGFDKIQGFKTYDGKLYTRKDGDGGTYISNHTNWEEGEIEIAKWVGYMSDRDNWKGQASEFVKEYGDDLDSFNKFLNGQYDSKRSRDILLQFWERKSTSNFRSNSTTANRYDDEDDEDDDNNNNNTTNVTSPVSTTTTSPTVTLPNTPTTAAGGAAPNRDSKRVRNLLKTYYGAAIGGDATVSDDPLNIDGPGFKLDQYFDNIVKTSTLQQLIAKDSEMVTEIRTLDGDMKTLVYNNYTKFINATDIIKKMKTNVENMEEGMELLSKNMDLISTCSEKINSTLSVRRDKIDQLSGLQKLLQKLQFLTALPSRLKHCAEVKAYVETVKYYNSNIGILKQYNHIPSFKTIQTECDSIMASMKSSLYERLSNINTPKIDIQESTEVLIDLLEPSSKVREYYLESRKNYSVHLLQEIEKKEYNDIVECISELNKSFLQEYSYNIASFTSIFINRFDGSTTTQEEVKKSKTQLDDFSRELFGKYLNIAKLKLASFNQPEEKIKGLEIIYNDVTELSKDRQMSELSSKITDIIISTVDHQITTYFENLQSTIKDHIYSMNNTLNQKKEDCLEGNFLINLSESTAKNIVDDINLLFKNLKPFFLPTQSSFLSRHFGTIFTKIQTKLQQFFLFLVEIHFIEYLDIITISSNKEQFSNRFLLVLSSVCSFIETKGINQVVHTMNDFITTVKHGMHAIPSQQEMTIISFNAPELSKRIRETSQKILTVYSRLQSNRVEKFLRKGLESTPNWLKLKEPRDVRTVIDLYLDELKKLQSEITKLLPTNGSLPTSNQSTPVMSRSHSRSQSSSGDQSQMKRNTSSQNLPGSSTSTSSNNNTTLFDKRLDIYAMVDFNANSILSSIVKISLKSYIESLRIKTFGTNGYHQIQVELHFLQMALSEKDMIGQNTTLDNLFLEAESTISERCIDPISLEKSIISKICETKLKKRKELELQKKLEDNTN
eukprot:gene8400-10316_t